MIGSALTDHSKPSRRFMLVSRAIIRGMSQGFADDLQTVADDLRTLTDELTDS